MADPIVLENILVVKSTADKVWKIDRDAGTTTLYASEATYDADTPVGTIQTQEIREIYEFVLNMDRQ